MSPKLIKTPLGYFAAIEWNGKNESGIMPFGDRILVFPDQAAATSPGGIAIPDDLRARLTQASETGILMAMGDDAWLWNGDRSRKFEGRKPQIGERIIFERYAGSFHEAEDGRCYRIMDDKCMGGFYYAASAAKKSTAAPALVTVSRPPLAASSRTLTTSRA